MMYMYIHVYTHVLCTYIICVHTHFVHVCKECESVYMNVLVTVHLSVCVCVCVST